MALAYIKMLVNSFQSGSQAQLYFGDLDSGCKEMDLYRLLSPFGEVSMIKLMRNPSEPSKTYAFVAYKDPLCSNIARRELNGAKFNNSYMRVSRVTNDRDPRANVFIKNIPGEATLKELEMKFCMFGSVVSSKIAYDSKGNSLKYGFVQFEKREKALEAIKMLNGTTWDDSTLSVCEFLPITSRALEGQNNLYIKGFPLEYTQDHIKAIFTPFGNVLSVGLMTAKTKEGERAFGFVCFSDSESAKKAITEMHLKKAENFEWYVVPHMAKNTRKAMLKSQYQQKIEEWKQKNLYIRNLPKHISEKQLKEICSEYGTISSLKISCIEHIRYNADGDLSKEFTSKGVGFVCFSQETSATQALKDLQEKTIEGQKLFIARWKPRNELIKLLMLKKQKAFNSYQNSGPKHPPVHMSEVKNFPQGPPKTLPFPSRNFPKHFASGGKGLMPYTQLPIRKISESAEITNPGTGSQKLDRESMGELLFPIVVQYSNELVAGKITGMMLEMGVPILSKLINDRKTLQEKILEAVEVLRKAWANNPGQLRILPNSVM